MPSAITRGAAAAAVLLLAVPVSAAAAEADEFAAAASTSAVTLSVLPAQTGESPVLDLVGTDAMVSSDPMATAGVDGVTVLGTAIGEVRDASSTGDAVRDPDAEADDCVIPTAVTGLVFDADEELEGVCAAASADAGPFAATSAAARAELLSVDVSGALLADALTEPLGAFVVSAGDILVEGAVSEFIEQCNELLAPADQIVDPAGDLIGMLPAELDPLEQAVSDAVGQADEDGYCAAVFNLSVGELADDVLAVDDIAAELAELDLLEISLDASSSVVAGDADSLDAEAEQATVRITGPDVLGDLDAVITALVEEIQAAVEAIAGDGDPLPLPDDFDLSAALDEIPLFGINGPLLEATVDGGSATSSLTQSDATSTSGGSEPSVSLTLSPGLLELFGQDPSTGEFALAAGESSGPIAEGTPLESSISVGALTTEDGVMFGDTDLTGSTATASATTVTVLSGVEGGITLVLAASSAGAFGSTAPAPTTPDEPTDPLPHTGGGAAAAAVLALGAAVALRRRRD